MTTGLFLAGCGTSAGLPSPQQASESEATSYQFTAETKDALDQVPAEFQEVTIPGLRQKNHPGSELEILDTYYSRPTHTAYRASYTSDGLTQYGLLTIPSDEPPEGGFPAVVFVHGYIPPTQYVTNQKYQDYVEYLARNGLVVFKIDLRGHDQSEGQPVGAYFSGKYVSDALNAVASLRQLENVDSNRVGMWGHSMAGNIVMRSLLVDPDISIGVIWAGAVYTYEDFREYRIQDSSFDRDSIATREILSNSASIFEEMGDIDLTTPFWSLVSPSSFLDELQTPVHIHHAVNDDVVSVEYARNIKLLLEAEGVPHEVYEYATGGHNLTGSSFSTAMQRSTEALTSANASE